MINSCRGELGKEGIKRLLVKILQLECKLKLLYVLPPNIRKGREAISWTAPLLKEVACNSTGQWM